jgi:ABC-type branched-subunit amino acid transport system ATPase component
MLQASHLLKRFSGVTAVRDVSFTLNPATSSATSVPMGLEKKKDLPTGTVNAIKKALGFR